MDSEFKRLWALLESRGMLDNLIVVFLSDHGEELGDHGDFGHKRMFEEVVHVPLFVRLPPAFTPVPRKRVPEPVSLIDVAPTLLDCLGLQIPPRFQGTSLRPLWEGGMNLKERPAFSECIDFNPEPPLVSVRYRNKKLMDYFSGKRYELYDLAVDRREMTNRLMDKELAEDGKDLLKLLKQWRTVNQKARKHLKAVPADMELTPENIEELKQLGY
jgi:arylsulfatase A-like enzyme